MFTDFLNKLNNTCDGAGVIFCAADDVNSDCTGDCGFVGYRDWRLAQVGEDGGTAELEAILDLTQGFCGGGSGACIDPIFGPTAASIYWSSTTNANNTNNAWNVNFNNGNVNNNNKNNNLFARAVRPCS